MKTRLSKRPYYAGSDAASWVLLDPDLVDIVMRHYARAVGGWNFQLVEACSVCRLWCDTIHSIRPELEQWLTYRWDINASTFIASIAANPHLYRHG